MWKGWSSIALVALVAAAAGLAQTGAGHAFLQRAGLFQPPVSYTTLAFAHPESLPIQLKSRHASLNVSFVIHNVSRSSHAYHWSILVVRAGRSHREAAGALQVPGEGRATVSRTVNRKCVGGGLRLVVRLATPPESVDFLATCSAGQGG